MPVFILGEQTWPFFCCAKCRCSPYVIKDGLLEVKPFNHGSPDGGVWRVGAVKGYYFNGRQKNSQYIHVLKKKKKSGNLFSPKIPVRKALPTKDTRILHLLSA